MFINYSNNTYMELKSYEIIDSLIQSSNRLTLIFFTYPDGPEFDLRQINSYYTDSQIIYASVVIGFLDNRELVRYREKYGALNIDTAVLFKNGAVAGTVEGNSVNEIKSMIDSNL